MQEGHYSGYSGDETGYQTAQPQAPNYEQAPVSKPRKVKKVKAPKVRQPRDTGKILSIIQRVMTLLVVLVFAVALFITADDIGWTSSQGWYVATIAFVLSVFAFIWTLIAARPALATATAMGVQAEDYQPPGMRAPEDYGYAAAPTTEPLPAPYPAAEPEVPPMPSAQPYETTSEAPAPQPPYPEPQVPAIPEAPVAAPVPEPIAAPAAVPAAPPVAAPIKPLRVKCPKCGAIMEITSTERPLSIQCKDCGTKGVLK